MVCSRGNTRSTHMLLCVVASMLLASPSLATSRVKQGRLPVGVVASAPNLAPGVNTTAQFFTIKNVLAGLDARRDGGHPPATDKMYVALPVSASVKAEMDVPPFDEPQRDSEPFGLLAFRAPNGVLWTKWRSVESAIAIEAKDIAACVGDGSNCSPAARRFMRIVDLAKARDGRARLEVVNRTVNHAVRYTSDYAQHGELDRWSSPLYTLASGRGDCEDYAIAKYLVLRHAGFAPEDLRLVLVRDRRAREDHAVLAARHDGRWLILDNRNASVLSEADVGHFVPLYALDNEGVKLFASPYIVPPAVVTIEPSPADWADVAQSSAASLSASDAMADRFASSAGLDDRPLAF